MATARELLEQVDALMLRNREEAANTDIPILTDVVGSDVGLAAAETVVATDEVAPASAGTAAMEVHIDPQRWDRTVDDIRTQVLQRLDVFADTGLQEQLRARLQPIVDRASADLVSAVNHCVAELLRSYVAEAVEREIDKWKERGN